MDIRDIAFIKAKRFPGAVDGGRRLTAALAVALILAVAGCLSPAPENAGGKLYRHNWWNYYARGLWFMKEGRTEEAASDFRRSLGVDPGARLRNGRDMWRARTYGLHFVEAYFPNRELGVCLYERGEFAEAARYLEISLSQEPSGRAKHYLNLARQKKMAGARLAPPSVTLDLAGGSQYTRERALTLRGEASGPGHISRLTVGGQAEFIELAEKAVRFERRLRLSSGTNTVRVVAEDLLGQRTVREVVRVADWQPPCFSVRGAAAQVGVWTVDGVCRDAFGIAEIKLGDEKVFSAEAGASREVPVKLRVPAAGATLSVTDMAGNRLECRLDAAALAQAEAERYYMLARAETSATDKSGAGFSFKDRVEAWADSRRARGAAEGFRTVVAASPAASGDRMRPALSLKACQPHTRVFSEDFFVDGTASDGGGLAGVTVNGEDMLSGPDKGTLRAYFARRLPLEMGTNEFEIVAVDLNGNRTSRAFTVVRALPEYLEERYRLSVGVPPLAPAEAGPVGVRVKRAMEAELAREPVRFRLLERDEGWDFVLREQGLSLSDLADPAAALRIGKMVPAEMLLMGRIFQEAKGVTVYLKAVETGNGEVVFASDVYSSDPEAGLEDTVGGLVLKVQQGFPLITGEVLRCQGSRVTLNVGRQDGASEKCQFIVCEAVGGGGLAAGRVCRAEDRPVQVKIEKVQQNTSTARVIPSSADALVKEGHYVYTR